MTFTRCWPGLGTGIGAEASWSEFSRPLVAKVYCHARIADAIAPVALQDKPHTVALFRGMARCAAASNMHRTHASRSPFICSQKDHRFSNGDCSLAPFPPQPTLPNLVTAKPSCVFKKVGEPLSRAAAPAGFENGMRIQPSCYQGGQASILVSL